MTHAFETFIERDGDEIAVQVAYKRTVKRSRRQVKASDPNAITCGDCGRLLRGDQGLQDHVRVFHGKQGE